VGSLGLLLGAGIGAAGKEKTTTVTVAGGLTTVHARERSPVRTVTRTEVHIHVHVHTITQTVTAPTSAAPSGNANGESEGEDEVGSSSHATDGPFCQEHECIGNFEEEEGTIVECSDGSYSHAGGISGACSDHGGEA
jgi:hypothetical protein